MRGCGGFGRPIGADFFGDYARRVAEFGRVGFGSGVDWRWVVPEAAREESDPTGGCRSRFRQTGAFVASIKNYVVCFVGDGRNSNYSCCE